MLITFRSKAWSNITMFGDSALMLLNMMGHSGTVPGALRAGEIPAALVRLEQALKTAGPEAENVRSAPSVTGNPDLHQQWNRGCIHSSSCSPPQPGADATSYGARSLRQLKPSPCSHCRLRGPGLKQPLGVPAYRR